MLMVRTLLIDGICEVDVGKGEKMIFIIKNKLRRMIKQIDMIIERKDNVVIAHTRGGIITIPGCILNLLMNQKF